MKPYPEHNFEVRRLTEEEGGGFLVTFPDLPGCMVDGETIEQAIAEAADAETSWLDTRRELGIHSFRRKNGLHESRGVPPYST